MLRILRDSGKSSGHTATLGAFQQMLSGRVVQMLRVTLESDRPCVPEVSANKYAINIRFTILDKAQINVEYMYAFVQHSGDNAVIIFRFDEVDKAIQVLLGADVRILKGEEVYAL